MSKKSIESGLNVDRRSFLKGAALAASVYCDHRGSWAAKATRPQANGSPLA